MCYLLHVIQNIQNVPHGIALRFRQNYETDEKFNNWSKEYKTYLIARDYNPGLADKQFENVKMMSKNNARTKNTKNKEMNKVKFITTFYPILTSIEALIKKTFTTCIQMKFWKKVFVIINAAKIYVIYVIRFTLYIIKAIYKHSKNLKEMVKPFLHP